MCNELTVPKALPKERRSPALPNFQELLVADRLVRQHGTAVKLVHWPTMPAAYPDDCPARKKSTLNFQHEALKKALARGADSGTLCGLIQSLEPALAEKPSRNVNRAVVALLLDSRTKQPPNPRVFIEALLYDLADEGFPPAVVAAACQTIRREQTFLPEIAQVLTACRKTRQAFQETLREASAAIASRDRMMNALLRVREDLAALPPPEPRQSYDPNIQPGDPG